MSPYVHVIDHVASHFKVNHLPSATSGSLEVSIRHLHTPCRGSPLIAGPNPLTLDDLIRPRIRFLGHEPGETGKPPRMSGVGR